MDWRGANRPEAAPAGPIPSSDVVPADLHQSRVALEWGSASHIKTNGRAQDHERSGHSDIKTILPYYRDILFQHPEND
jgi:hypothetical protein